MAICRYVILILVLVNLWQTNANAQENYTLADLQNDENEVYSKFEQLKQSTNDSIKLRICDSVSAIFARMLRYEISFSYPFTLLENVSKLASDDKFFRIYTWNLSYNDGTYTYFGFMQYKTKKQLKMFKLIDKSAFMENPQNAFLTPENWYGALYYDIIMVKEKKVTSYTLIGWDGADNFINRKIIETVVFNSSGVPKFGGSVQLEKARVRRAIFEYNNKATMVLRFDKAEKMIVMDHLSPSEKKYAGQYQFYGPDFSFDGLLYKDGKWNYYPDIDVRNPKQKEIKRNDKRDN